jgi:hypothetical protein
MTTVVTVIAVEYIAGALVEIRVCPAPVATSCNDIGVWRDGLRVGCNGEQLHVVNFLFTYGTEVEQSLLLLRSIIGLLYQPRMIDGDDCGVISVE